MEPDAFYKKYEHKREELSNLINKLKENNEVLKQESLKPVLSSYLDLVAEVMRPFLGVKCLDKHDEFMIGGEWSGGRRFGDRRLEVAGPRVETGEDGRICKITVPLHHNQYYFMELSCDSVVFKKKTKSKVRKKTVYIDLNKEDFVEYGTRNSSNAKYLAEYSFNSVKSFYKDFDKFFERKLSGCKMTIDGKREHINEINNSTNSVVRFSEGLRELKLASYKSAGEPVFSFSLSEILDLGFLDKLEYERLEKELSPLFHSRDVKIPVIVRQLEDKPEKLLKLRKALEAEAKKEISNIITLDELNEALSYYRRCNLPIDDVKKQAMVKIKAKFNKEFKRLEDI